ncbi:citrate (Si)-synthase [bacterium]|nr:citrate (Si)-synthase [bacterium]
MSIIKEKLSAQIPALRDEIKQLLAENGELKISDVTVAQAYGGMRGIKGMICDTSVVEPDSGVIFRGHPLLEVTHLLPEEIFWLLLTGEIPSETERKSLRAEFASHNQVPQYVWDVLDSMPADSHPMTMLNTAILVMQHESQFAARYHQMHKLEYWEAALDDSLSILGKLPNIAAAIYRKRFNKGERLTPNPELDWAANYAYMLGMPQTEDAYKMMRLYLMSHSDHEGGNASAFTCHTVGSALSDPFYAVSAGLNALAGPLHGLANQECLGFVLDLKEKLGGGVPTKEELTKACWDRLNSGQVIPGYGHAVLRVPDPRFVAFINFGREHFPDDEVFALVNMLYEVVPQVLTEQGKAKSPWPNVDASSGTLLYHYGLKEFEYYTVVFSVSRAMGMLAQYVLNRAIGSPITRPKSVSTEWVKQQVAAASASS